MKMFAIGCVALFLVVVVTALIKAKSPGGQATRRQGKKNKASKLGSNPLDSVKLQQNTDDDEVIDADSALGLKPTEMASQEEYVGQAQEVPQVEIDHSQQPKIEYVVFNVMAPAQKEFGGYELLQALLSNGLRYSKKKIFDFYHSVDGHTEILFSLASVNKPGTFDLPKMSEFACPGLTMFMVVKELSDPVIAFDQMLKVAKQLADDLGGDIYAQNRQPVDQDQVRELRTALGEYKNTKTTADLFE